MLELLREPEAKAVLGVTIVLFASVILLYIVLKIRNVATHGHQHRGEYLTEFRDMYEQGAMSEFEFRRVKSELQDSVKQGPEQDSEDQADQASSADESD